MTGGAGHHGGLEPRGRHMRPRVRDDHGRGERAGFANVELAAGVGHDDAGQAVVCGQVPDARATVHVQPLGGSVRVDAGDDN